MNGQKRIKSITFLVENGVELAAPFDGQKG